MRLWCTFLDLVSRTILLLACAWQRRPRHRGSNQIASFQDAQIGESCWRCISGRNCLDRRVISFVPLISFAKVSDEMSLAKLICWPHVFIRLVCHVRRDSVLSFPSICATIRKDCFQVECVIAPVCGKRCRVVQAKCGAVLFVRQRWHGYD